MNAKPFSIHPIIQAETGEPLKAILPTDGTRGFVVGEDWEIKALISLLEAYLQTGQHDGEIHEYHEQLGYHWLTCGDASRFALEQRGEIIPLRTIRYAAKNGFIPGAEKQGRDWVFPQVKFTAWLRNRPKPGRK